MNLFLFFDSALTGLGASNSASYAASFLSAAWILWGYGTFFFAISPLFLWRWCQALNTARQVQMRFLGSMLFLFSWMLAAAGNISRAGIMGSYVYTHVEKFFSHHFPFVPGTQVLAWIFFVMGFILVEQFYYTMRCARWLFQKILFCMPVFSYFTKRKDESISDTRILPSRGDRIQELVYDTFPVEGQTEGLDESLR